jgi:hypothetical protein
VRRGIDIMPHEVKIAIIKRARLARGLVNVLKDDVECVNIDAEYFDLYNITESIKEAIRTVDKLKEDLEKLNDILPMDKK